MTHLLISQKQRDQICVMLESLKPEFGTVGSRDVEVRMRRDDVDLIISTLAALTQPASPALKLPDEMVESGVNGRLYHNEGWNACLSEVKRLNAPHAAPIAPICATGGAEWVKLEDELPKDGSWCIAIEEGDFAGDVVYWGNGEWRSEFGRDEYTHWMYHPTAQEEE